MQSQNISYFTQRKSEIAQRLRQVRRQSGWTQQKVANLLGCSRRRYNSVERGEAELGVTEIDLLAREFNVPVEVFFEKGNQQSDS